MGWAVQFSDSEDEPLSPPPQRDRSRSPAHRIPQPVELTPPEGIAFWFTPLWQAIKPIRCRLGQQLRPIILEADCDGTLPEAFILKA